MSGVNRPTMKEVADKLGRLRKIMKHPWAHEDPEELDRLLGEPSTTANSTATTGNFIIAIGEPSTANSTSNTGNFSITKRAAMGLESGR
jgi:hypothetical protein